MQASREKLNVTGISRKNTKEHAQDLRDTGMKDSAC
jgi:biotin operon repressor